MIQLLPTGEFNWVDPSKFTMADKTDSYANWDSNGYILEVDVRYPKVLHDYHNDLPFNTCKNMKINRVDKLVPNLYDKHNYVVHIRALNQALKHGLILEKVHQVIEFSHSVWLKPYINFNTKLRRKPRTILRKTSSNS